MQTEIIYMYRDASNYKFHGTIIVAGYLSLAKLEPFLFDQEFFIPHEVGLKHLLDKPMNSDDHYLHSFIGFETAADKETLCTSTDLVARFQKAHELGWFSSFD